MPKFNYYPKPWRFEEGKDEVFRVVDATGCTICSFCWPCHSKEDEDKAVNEVEALARAVADIGNLDH